MVAPLYVTLAIIAPGCGPRCLRRINASRDMWTRIISPPPPRSRHSVAGTEPAVRTAATVIGAYTALAKATAETAKAAAMDAAARAAGIVYVDEALARARAERQRNTAQSVAAANASASIAAGVAATARAEMQRVAAAITAATAKHDARVIATAAEATAAAGASPALCKMRCNTCSAHMRANTLTRVHHFLPQLHTRTLPPQLRWLCRTPSRLQRWLLCSSLRRERSRRMP